MSIHISHSNNAKILGLAQGIEYLGLEAFFWHPKTLSVFDLIANHKPSVIFLQDEDINGKTIEYAKHEFPQIKFVLLQNKPNTPTAGIDLVIRIDTNDLVYDTEWRLPYLANTVLYKGGIEDSKYNTDILFISNDFDIDNKMRINLLNSLGTKYRLKVYGNTKVPVVYYLGQPPQEEYRHILASAKVILMFNEEWLLNAAINEVTPLCFSSTGQADWNWSSYSEIIKKCDECISARPSWLDYLHQKAICMTYVEFARHVKERLEL